MSSPFDYEEIVRSTVRELKIIDSPGSLAWDNLAFISANASGVLERIILQSQQGTAERRWWDHHFTIMLAPPREGHEDTYIERILFNLEVLPTALQVIEVVLPNANFSSSTFSVNKLIKETRVLYNVYFSGAPSWDERRALAIVHGIGTDSRKLGSPTFYADIAYISQNLPTVMNLLPILKERGVVDHAVIRDLSASPLPLVDGVL